MRRAWQHQTYQQVHDLTQLGWSYGAIAAYLHINRHTVSKYARRDHWVESAFGSRASTAEPYREYLEQRWDKGCSNRRQLWRELQEQGFAGSYISVWKLTRGWVPLPGTEVDVIAPPADRPPPLVPPRPAARHTVRQVAWLLQASADRLPSDDAFCQVLGTTCPDLALAAELAQSFGSLIREHRLEALDAWLAQAESSGLRELRRFALSLRQDYAAVRAAVEEMWSQGPTEGHIQRLKLLKRQGYGRASFRLLRQRVLLRPAVKTPM